MSFADDTFLPRIGILIVVILLILYALLSWVGFQETHDAKMVESVQVSLQEALSDGMTQLNLPPSAISPQNIINAARIKFPKGVLLDPKLHLVIQRSGREAQYAITEQGDVLITALTNFNRYHLDHGRVMRNNRWLLALPEHWPSKTETAH